MTKQFIKYIHTEYKHIKEVIDPKRERDFPYSRDIEESSLICRMTDRQDTVLPF